MLTLTSDQDALLGAESKKVSWLFTVTVDSVTYEWSTKNYTFGGNNYENRVIPASFNGVELNRSMSEYGILAPSMLLFEVSNDDSSLSAADFGGCDVQLDLVLNDWSDEQIIASWRFTVLSVTELQGTLRFSCEDFLSKYLEGDYPNTTLISQLSPDPSLPNDNMCVPIPFGTVYIPLRFVSADSSRYYLLGPAARTYTLLEIRSPEDWGSTSIWEHDSIYDFVQSTKTLDGTSLKMFRPLIDDSDTDGVYEACGLWTQGGKFLDPYVKFYRDDLENTTDPADIIEYLLKDFGVASADIDTGVGSSFALASATYTSWGLALNGAFFYKMPRQEALSLILLSCNSTLRVTDKLELHVLSKTSQMTIDGSVVLKSGTIGETTFTHQDTIGEVSDYGFVAYVQSGEPQGRLVKLKAAAKGTYLVSSGDTLELPLVNDGQDATRAGILYYQRSLGDDGQLSFDGVEECLVLQPNDVITINDADYGGVYTAIVDSIRIGRDLTIGISAIKNRFELDDWEDLSPPAVTVADEEAVSGWTPVVSGGSSDDVSGGSMPNLVHGILRVGAGPDCILIDSNNTLISIYEGGVARVKLGDLGSQGFGLIGRDASNNIIFNIDADSALIAGWSFDNTKLYTANIIIDSANQRIRSSNYVAGPDGAGFTIQSDLVEAGDIRARGVLQTVVFRKDCISAISGDLLIVKNADVLDADMTALDAATMTITGAVSFAANDKLRLKNVTDEEWITVVSAAGAPTYTLTRDRGTDYSPNANPAWKKGTAVINYGQTSAYGILITAHQTNNPYLSFFQVPSSPWTTALTEIVRIGQLNGFAGYSTSTFGFAVYYSSYNYVKIDATNGIQMSITSSGGITIASGGGITVSSGGSILVSGGGGITVYDGANITILAGGDLIVQAGVSTDAVISLTDSSGVARLNLTYFPDVVYSSINPGVTTETYNLTIGQASYKWAKVYLFAQQLWKFYAYYNSSYNSYMECNASASNTYITLNTGSGAESLYIDHDGNVEISRGDLYLEYGEIFIKASGTTEGKIYAMTDTLYIVPPSDGASSAYLGTSGYRFTDVHIFGSTQALLRWYSDSSNQAYVQVASIRCRMYTIGTGSYVDIYTAGTQRWKIDSSGNEELISGNITVTLGSVYAKTNFGANRSPSSYVNFYSTTNGAGTSYYPIVCYKSNGTDLCFYVRDDGYGYIYDTVWHYGPCSEDLKENVRDLKSETSDIKAVIRGIVPKRFDYKKSFRETNRLNKVGYIAEQLESVIPGIIDYNTTVPGHSEPHMTFDRDLIIPYMVLGVHNIMDETDLLRLDVDGLRSLVADLRSEIDLLKGGSN